MQESKFEKNKANVTAHFDTFKTTPNLSLSASTIHLFVFNITSTFSIQHLLIIFPKVVK